MLQKLHQPKECGKGLEGLEVSTWSQNAPALNLTKLHGMWLKNDNRQMSVGRVDFVENNVWVGSLGQITTRGNQGPQVSH